MKKVLLIIAGSILLLLSVAAGVYAQENWLISLFPKKLLTFSLRRFKPLCGFPGYDLVYCHAKVVTQNDGVTPLAGSTPLSTSLGPTQFHMAYQLPCQPGGGVQSGCSTPSQFGPATIAIVDAFHAPTLENDLTVYSNYFGIPVCTKASGCLTVVDQNGGQSLPTQVNSGWAMETSLDVEIAHAICQTCKILLVEVNSNSFLSMGTGVNTAARLGAMAISNSYGGAEWSGEKSYDSYYNHPGIAVTASSGDNGYGAEYPATSPNVVGVGGTTLQIFTDFSYASESVWSGTGSGCSRYETASPWQTSLPNWNQTACLTHRAIADVAADADPNTGAAVYDSTAYGGQTGWWQVGGTSLSSPIIAAAFALAGGVAPSTQAPSVLYANSTPLNFHDITTGANGSCPTIMCKAVSGFDGPTGLGTPEGIGGFGPVVFVSPTPTPIPPIDNIAPVVTITSPTDGSTVRRNSGLTIRASASDNIGVTKVEFYINASLLSTSMTSPYRASWAVPSARNVKYVLAAKAYDAAGNSSSSAVMVTSR